MYAELCTIILQWLSLVVSKSYHPDEPIKAEITELFGSTADYFQIQF